MTPKRDAYGQLMDEFNRQPLLPQESLASYFARARILIMELIAILVSECDHVQRSIATLAVDRCCKLDHHRIIFKRSATVPLRNGTSRKARKAYETRRLLEQTMDIADGHTAGDVDFQVNVVMDLALTRYEFHSILEVMDEDAAHYIAAHDKRIAKRKSRPRLDTKAERDTMREIEETWGINRFAAYGIFRMVLKRLEAVRSLYQDVFNAYARLLLGVANATSNAEHRLDTIQDGAPGLWYAVASYDQNSSNALAAHARWWIRQQALHRMKTAFNMIKPSLGLYQQGIAFEKLKRSHEAQYGPLGANEVPANIGLSAPQVEAIQKHQLILQVTSLDATVQVDSSDRDAGSLTVHSALGDHEQQAEKQEVEERQEAVGDMLKRFDPVTRKLLCFHFGLWEYLEDQELSPKLVLHERIRQITASTLQNLGKKTKR